MKKILILMLVASTLGVKVSAEPASNPQPNIVKPQEIKQVETKKETKTIAKAAPAKTIKKTNEIKHENVIPQPQEKKN